MDKITLLDKTFVKYISEKEIEEATERVARQINEDYKDDQPYLLVTLNGAIMFAVELMKKLTIPCRITCVKLSSYSGTTSTNKVKELVGLNDDLTGQRVFPQARFSAAITNRVRSEERSDITKTTAEIRDTAATVRS